MTTRKELLEAKAGWEKSRDEVAKLWSAFSAMDIKTKELQRAMRSAGLDFSTDDSELNAYIAAVRVMFTSAKKQMDKMEKLYAKALKTYKAKAKKR